jgi:hypothetical protein
MALTVLMWPTLVERATGVRPPARPKGVGDRIWNDTEHGAVGAITIRYSNDSNGVRTANQDTQELAILGYRAVSSGATGSHTNIGRTAVNAAAAAGMARVLGIGFFKTSKNSGEMLVRYERTGS